MQKELTSLAHPINQAQRSLNAMLSSLANDFDVKMREGEVVFVRKPSTFVRGSRRWLSMVVDRWELWPYRLESAGFRRLSVREYFRMRNLKRFDPARLPA